MRLKHIILLVFSVLSTLFVSAQNSSFYVGFKSGAYFASKNSAIIYNGTGTRGINSIYNRNNLETQIQEELKYPFELSEAPLNISYNTALSIGGTLGVILDEGSSIILSVDLINLEIEDAYTVSIEDPNQLENVIEAFPVLGKEKRLNIDFGYKNIFDTESEKMKPYFNLGVNALFTEFVNNQIYIGNLGPYNIFPEGFQLQNSRQSGFGLGGFGGLGINYSLGNGTSVELEYSAKYSTVNFGDVKFKGLNHGLSLCFIWGK